MLEGYTALGFLAAHTTTVKLQLLVTGVTYRHPGLLAKTVTTLDVLSGGRAQLGIGAAWFDREHEGLGVPFPPLAERFERLEEALQICLQMWSDDDGPYKGKHYQLAETLCDPMPLSSPRPPILIAGMGEKKTLRMVAQYADECNFADGAPAVVKAKLDILRAHCENLGRDYATIKPSVLVRTDPFDDRDNFLSHLDALAELGVGVIDLVPRTDDPLTWVRRVAEDAIPQIKARG
jgi:F420-dependent oxidoreductase-like protein